MINIKMDWMSWTETQSKQVIMVQDKFFIVQLVGKADRPTEAEAFKLLGSVLDCYSKFMENAANSDMAEKIKVLEVEYYWNWEKDKESGASAGSLFDHPGFKGIVDMQCYAADAEQLLDLLKEEFGK